MEVVQSPSSWKKNRQGFRDFIANVERLGDEYLVQKAPFQLPPHIKEFLVKAAPYITAIILLLMLPAILAVIGLWSIISVVNPYYSPLLVVSTAFSIAVFALYAISIKPLANRQRRAWNYMFYASLLSLIGGVLGGSIIGSLVWTIVGLYFLFQLKEYYK